jgi:hypothetical protein
MAGREQTQGDRRIHVGAAQHYATNSRQGLMSTLPDGLF